MLANPYVPVQPENEVDATGEGSEVGFEAPDENGRDRYELAVSELRGSTVSMGRERGRGGADFAVSQRAGV